MLRERRGFTILVVLVIVTSSVLIATGLILTAQAEVAAGSESQRAVQTRATAWSGLQVAMLRLNRQRDEILEGRQPELGDRFEIYEADGRRGLVRFLPVTPGGEVLAPEAGKLDLNIATAEMLVDTGWLEPDLAESIIQFREQMLGGHFRAVEDLLHVPGVSVEAFFGELEDLERLTDRLRDDQDIVERMQARFGGADPRGLVDLFTADSVEPALQRDGRRRINLNVEWSEELGERLDERFGSGAGALVQQIIEDGTEFDDDSVITGVLNAVDLEIEAWPEILDALTTEAGEYHFGRVDLNCAHEDVLAALPGIAPDQAAQIVRVRESIADDQRWSIVWPVEEGIIDREAFAELAGRLTTRSWRYRVRLAAGEVDMENEDRWIGRPRIYEAVIDLSGTSPRLSSLREITMLPIAATLALSADWIEEDDFDEPWWDEDEQDEPPGEGVDELTGPDEGDLLPPADGEPVEEETILPGEQAAPGQETGGGARRPGRWRPR